MNIKQIKFLKRGVIVLSLAFLISFLAFVHFGKSQTLPYYYGDAVNYQDKVVFGTANSGYLEIFVLQDKQINRAIKIKNYLQATSEYRDFTDLKFSVEGGRLYVYALSEYTLFKYDFSDLQNLSLITKQTNTYWDWYHRLDQFGSNLGTISDAGIRTLNSALQAIESFKFAPSDQYSIRGGESNRYIFGIDNSNLQIYDRTSRTVAQEIPLNFNSEVHGRKTYYDALSNQIYAVDDYYLKKFSVDGKLLASFKHLNAPGYDVDSTSGNGAVYFSNGLGVVKINKDNFKLAAYAYTTTLGGPQGWAMGLKVVNTDAGDVVVVFNNSNILLLDKNLRKIADVRATDLTPPHSSEILYINLDHNIGGVGATLALSGGGYWPNESLRISFGGQVVNTSADKNGRFSSNLTVPNLAPQKLDIKVEGLDSLLTYSIGFTIQ